MTIENTNTDISTEDTGLKNKNAELKRERDEFKRQLADLQRERDSAAAQRERDDKDITALEARLKREHIAALKAVEDERDQLANDLKEVRINNEIKTAITSNKVMPEWAELVESHLLRRVTYEDGVATIEGKSIADAAKAYLKTPTGLKTVSAPESSGSGSTGATTVDTSGWKEAPQTAEDYNRYMKLTVDNPTAATALADKWNRPDLKP